MRRLIIAIVSLVLIFTIQSKPLFAQSNPVATQQVNVSASIGAYYLTFSGYIAPFASITLVLDNTILSSVVANANGYFHLDNVFVKSGFDHFCFTAVDVKRLGESDACYKIPPISKNSEIQNIFLPPTIGLYRTEINAGSNALVYGYSMPGALVSIHLSDGNVYTVTADASGYYEIRPKISTAGKYELFADATYQKVKSKEPANKVVLTAIALQQQVTNTVANWLRQLITLLTSIWPLWVILALIILIFILWKKIKQSSLAPIGNPGEGKFQFDFLFKRRKLHHAWFVGF